MNSQNGAFSWLRTAKGGSEDSCGGKHPVNTKTWRCTKCGEVVLTANQPPEKN